MSSKGNIDSDHTCAGKPISATMHMFSHDFVTGCKMFAEKAQDTDNDEETRALNAACVLFATSAVESKVNEWISIAQKCFMDEPKSFWHALAPVKTLKLEEKWNLIVSHENGTLWDKSREPFQSFDLITSLRNELVHYKGEFLPKDVSPTKKIKGLMDMLGVKSESSFIEDDCSSWVYDLLNSQKLGAWVVSKITEFDKNLMQLLNGSTEHRLQK